MVLRIKLQKASIYRDKFQVKNHSYLARDTQKFLPFCHFEDLWIIFHLYSIFLEDLNWSQAFWDPFFLQRQRFVGRILLGNSISTFHGNSGSHRHIKTSFVFDRSHEKLTIFLGLWTQKIQRIDIHFFKKITAWENPSRTHSPSLSALEMFTTWYGWVASSWCPYLLWLHNS